MPEFIKGMRLCELFYLEAVQPVMAEYFPRLAYSSARLDEGSDVLGFDTPQSMDHCWGPKATLFVSEEDYPQVEAAISRVMAGHLPFEIHGYPTHFRDKQFDGGFLQSTRSRPIDHYVTVTTIPRFFTSYLAVDIEQPLHPADWLQIPQQKLRTIASGKVFHDGLGRLRDIQSLLGWYPRDLWLYLMANQWRHIDQEEPFMGRCGDVGDELGSRLVAARLVQNLMSLCFLMERQYAPYSKWFGTAFNPLNCAAELTPLFHRVFNSAHWKEREEHLSHAYRKVMTMHNDLCITSPLAVEISPFFNRPYSVPHSGRHVEALLAAVQSPEVRTLPPYAGSINQLTQSIDLLENNLDIHKISPLWKETRPSE